MCSRAAPTAGWPCNARRSCSRRTRSGGTYPCDLADSYDYFYVPTYYVGGEKVHEGHAEREDVEKVLRLAAEE